MPLVRLKIGNYGGTRRYGKSPSYKFSPSALPWLLAMGWQEVHRGTSYVYLAPPDPAYQGKYATVEASIPGRAEIEWLAHQLHNEGRPWKGQIAGWPASYQPPRTDKATMHVIDPRMGERTETSILHKPALFEAGLFGIWQVRVKWDDKGTPQLKELAEFA